MKTGDYVKVVDAQYRDLTKGKIYRVLGTHSSMVTLREDSGDLEDFWVNRVEKWEPRVTVKANSSVVGKFKKDNIYPLVGDWGRIITIVGDKGVEIKVDSAQFTMKTRVPYQVGELLKCRDAGNQPGLTTGRVYEVVSDYENDRLVCVKSDDGEDLSYYDWRFTSTGEFKGITPEAIESPQEFEVGCTLKCVGTPEMMPHSLTIGHEYKALDVEKTIVKVENNDGRAFWFLKRRFVKVADAPVCTDESWNFEITTGLQIDDAELAASVSRKKPVLYVDDEKNSVIFMYIHTTLQYKIDNVGSPAFLSKIHVAYKFDNCWAYGVKREDLEEVLEGLKSVKATKWTGDGKGRRRVTVVLQTL